MRVGMVFFLTMITVAALSGCISLMPAGATSASPTTDEKSSNDPKQNQGKSEPNLLLSAAEPPAAQRDVASLQSKVESLERTVKTLRGEIALLKRGLRSGLFEDVNGSAAAGANSNPTTDLGFEDTVGPDATGQDLAQSVAKEGNTDGHQADLTDSTSLASLKKSEEPNKLIEQALANVQSRDPAAALVALNTLREKYPGFPNEGLSDVLMAECWNALNSPEKALGPIERFLSIHSTSALLPRAKLAQALAYRTLGESQKSIQLLLEVIALAPETKTADAARARLAELREIR